MEELEVPTEHLHEKIHEAAHEGKDRWSLYVALATAFIAVLAAIAGLMGGDHSNKALQDQIEASNQWSLYQAKGIKREVISSKADIISATTGKEAPADVKATVKRYKTEQDSILKNATTLESSSKENLDKHEEFAKSVTFFQISIAISAIAIITRRKGLFYASLALAAAGTWFLGKGII